MTTTKMTTAQAGRQFANGVVRALRDMVVEYRAICATSNETGNIVDWHDLDAFATGALDAFETLDGLMVDGHTPDAWLGPIEDRQAQRQGPQTQLTLEGLDL